MKLKISQSLRLFISKNRGKKEKGLCYWCGLKFSYGHKCMKPQLIQLLAESMDEKNNLDALAVENEQPILFLQAMMGSHDFQTMRGNGKTGEHAISILVDSGSIH
uniref:Uncharacterized protein n=1 Tax=Gossypium raimondii TaxID=29730 RepID=A0A0D2SC43_GOSRA|nr:hypothetical protein B456_013G110400 [Gossypium raimondii]